MLLIELIFILDQNHALDIGFVVGDYLGKFGEVPGVPFLDTHAEEVEVFLHLGYEGCGLEDVFVLLFDVFGDSVAGVEMGETELGGYESFESKVLIANIFTKQLPNRPKKLKDHLITFANIPIIRRQRLSQYSLLNSYPKLLSI